MLEYEDKLLNKVHGNACAVLEIFLEHLFKGKKLKVKKAWTHAFSIDVPISNIVNTYKKFERGKLKRVAGDSLRVLGDKDETNNKV